MNNQTTFRKLLIAALLLPAFAFGQVPQNVFPSIGNVGIGTSTPLEALHIKTGTVRLEALSAVMAEPRYLMIDPSGKIVAGAPCLTCGIIGGGAPTLPKLGYWKLAGNDSLNGANNWLGTKNNAPLIIKTFNTPRMIIDGGAQGNINMLSPTYFSDKVDVIGNISTHNDIISWGRMAIGKADFSDVGTDTKLAVEGLIAAREVRVVVGPFPDYVFEAGYPLMSLKDLENYIHANKHLPGIPSAGEVAQNKGIELGEMNVKLLEKVEELTLHLIQLQKQNEAIQAENAAIKEQLSKLTR